MTVLVVVLASLTLAACSSAEKGRVAEPGKVVKVAEKADLPAYLAADTKTADFVLTSTGSSDEITGTLWVEGRKFRYTINRPGKPMHEVMSPDGKLAYFVFHEKKVCEPSVAAVDRYLVEFSEPATGSVEDGVDEATGAKRVTYPIRELDDLAGADNAWWTEDVTFLVKDGMVIGTLTRGDAPDKDGKTELRTTRRILSGLKIGVPIPADTFTLPYPVKSAE